MSDGFDPNFDWASGSPTPNGEADSNRTAIDDFEIPEVNAANSVEEIDKEAAERSFQNPPPGDYIFRVAGFLKPPYREAKTGYYGGQFVTYNPYKVAVKLTVKDHPNLTILDFFELPPTDPQEIVYFQGIQSKVDDDKKNSGFMNRKFEHFIGKLGFDYTKGAPLPAEARKLSNWVGREVFATVIPGQPEKERKNADGTPMLNPATGEPWGPKINRQTGLPYEPKPQIRLFSYKSISEAPVGDAAAAESQGGAVNGAPQHAKSEATKTEPNTNGVDKFKQSGLASVV